MNPSTYCYEIRVAEYLENRWSHWFVGMEIISTSDARDEGTLLRGTLPDQAALFGLLGRIRDLNLTLLEVKRIREDGNRSTNQGTQGDPLT